MASNDRLQQGFATRGMGFRAHFARQQFSEAHVRFGSKADVTLLNFNVRFTPESDIAGRQFDVR
jgi:hypothetical protein